MNPWIDEHADAIREAAALHGARNVRVFGSFARGEETEASDVDLLVEFQADAGIFEQIELKEELETRLKRRVDVVTPGALHWYIRDKVLEEAVSL